jgi:hypothetical protein
MKKEEGGTIYPLKVIPKYRVWQLSKNKEMIRIFMNTFI